MSVNQLQPQIRKSMKSGLICEGAVSENDYPQDAVVESLNFHFDIIGAATLRPGTTIVGGSMGGSNILGLYQFRDSGAGTNNQLIAVNDSTLYYLASGTWTAKRTGLTSGSKARFSTFLDYVFMVNGTEATQTWDGSPGNSFGNTNAASAPIGKYIENYRARMWIAGNTTYPDRLYYSSVPSAVTTPVITWDTSVTTGQWIDISPSDGENITALHRTKVALLVFKNNHIYQVYSILNVDADPKIDVGTYSQESVVEAKNGVYFHHPTGFYRYANGGVQEISQPIIDIVKNISLSNYSKVTGYIDPQGNHICWSVGDVTIGNTTFTNLVVRYTISTGVWTHYSYPTQFTASAPYNDGTKIYTVVGDTAGSVFKTDTGVTDNGTEILYSLSHPFDSIDGLRSTDKQINTMYFMHAGLNGANVNWQNEDDIKTNNFTKKVGQLVQVEGGFNNLLVKGRKIKFRISGTSKGQPARYEGFHILKGTTQLVTFP